MYRRNDGNEENNAAQNCFTAYLQVALRNTRVQYLRKMALVEQYERVLDTGEIAAPMFYEPDMLKSLPFLELIENAYLQAQLQKIKERDLHILIRKILDDRPLREIAQELGISFNTASVAYQRTLRKLRKSLGEAGNGF